MRFVILACAGFIVGCTSIDAADLETHGMHPFMSITSSAENATSNVDVTFHVGDSATDFANLGTGDAASVTAGGGAAITLDEHEVLGVSSYTATLQTKETSTAVVVALTRADKESAPTSTVTMTEQITLTAPAPGGTSSRANDDVVLTWTNSAVSADALKVGWSGDCVDGGSVDLAADALTATIAKGTIAKRQGDNIADNCDVTFSVVRTRTGTLDPAYGGGSIQHSFSASAKLTSQP